MEASSVRKDNLLSGFDNIPGEEFGKHRSCYASYTNVKRLREDQGNVMKRRSSRDSCQQGIVIMLLKFKSVLSFFFYLFKVHKLQSRFTIKKS